jgi:hypothetical protein
MNLSDDRIKNTICTKQFLNQDLLAGVKLTYFPHGEDVV